MGRKGRRRWRKRFCRSEFALVFCLIELVGLWTASRGGGRGRGFGAMNADKSVNRYWYLLLILAFLVMSGGGASEEKK